MKTIIKFQIITTLLGAGALWAYGLNEGALAFIYGSILMLINIALLAFAWGQIFKKKYIALSALVIVSKYAILGTILYYFVKTLEVDLLWFSMGVSSPILPAIVYAIKESSRSEVDDGI
ncbi:MAG: hypothetical protein ACLGGX_01770 [Bdellovibrionia bacterium]